MPIDAEPSGSSGSILFRPKNWDRFQHYKDRSPPWIKLHRDILNDHEFMSMSLVGRAIAPLVWLLACESSDGSFDSDPESICWRLRCPLDEVVEGIREMIDAGLLLEVDGRDERTPAERNGYGTRYIAKEIRELVWSRDEGKCRYCGRSDDIEYDHIVPVSRGGTGEADNVQLLCRPCNRRKRSKTYGSVSSATQSEQKPSLRTQRRGEERREEREREVHTPARAREPNKGEVVEPSAKDRKAPVPRPEGVSEQLWADWLAHRRKKRATVTATAMAAIAREATSAGMDLSEALTMAVAQGWQGFRAEWALKSDRRSGANLGPPRVIPAGYYGNGTEDPVSDIPTI